MAESCNHNDPIAVLLAALCDSRDSAAWRTFLRDYGAVMMSVVNQYAADPHDAQDGFLHICEKLCEQDFRRLRAFDPSHGGTFTTWLTSVSSNLCADWCRARYGRPGVPAMIRSLPDLEQRVFQLSVVEGVDHESCLIGLRQRFPRLTRLDLSKALANVHRALTPRQRWKYTAFRQRGRVIPLDPGSQAAASDRQIDPQAQTSRDERSAVLRSALAHLSARQRLMLRLRFEQDMTLAEVAAVVGLDDLHQARRMIHAALRELSEHLRKTDFL